MEQCVGNNFIINNQLFSEDKFVFFRELQGFSIYEIVRVELKVPLFLDDHLKRFYHSMELEALRIREDSTSLEKQMDWLIRNNDFSKGKIKLIANFYNYPDSDSYNLLQFFTDYSFPEPSLYKTGVKAIICKAVRKDPNAKVLNTEARKIADQRIHGGKVYEAILVDSEGYITEGSRSNFFGIKNDVIYTPPDDFVLQGIVRKKVLEICRENSINYKIAPIHQDELVDFQSVFITGTTPKVLPVNQIDSLAFNVDHELLNRLMVKFNEKVINYISNKK